MTLFNQIFRPIIGVLVAIASVVTVIGLYAVSNIWISNFDRGLIGEFAYIHNGVRVWTDGDVFTNLDVEALPQLQAKDGLFYEVRRQSDGAILEKSPNLRELNIELPVPQGVSPHRQTIADAAIVTGETVRIVAQIIEVLPGWDTDDVSQRPVPSALNPQYVLLVARDSEQLEDQIFNLVVTTIGLWAIGLLGAGASAAMTVRRTTQNLIAPEHLRDLPLESIPEELHKYRNHLDELEERIQTKSLQEQRFTADAAHELRTPIAELRTLTDVALAFPDDIEHLEGSIRQSNKIAIQLGSLVNALLGIAREETVRRDLVLRDVDLIEMVRSLVALHREQVNSRGLKFELDLPDSHIHRTDEALIKSILENLIGNAVAYAPDDATIRIFYSGGTNGMRFDISNPAPELSQEDARHLFEPFWRKRGAKTDRDHSGLGLALAASFADILEMDLDARLLSDGRVQFTLKSRG